ncbi:DUF4179 domain-containing protein [Paenibacillus sp. BAC0078]
MDQNEERLLKDYFHGLSLEAEEVSEVKLNAAIRGGVFNLRHARMPAGRRYSLGVLALLAIVLLFAFPWIGERVKPQNTQSSLAQSHNWGEFEVFRTVVGSNLTVSSALDAGLVQRINGISAEKNGYTLTVDGIAADQKGIIVLYSLQNNNRQSQSYMISLTGNNTEYAARKNDYWNDQKARSGVTRGYAIWAWGRNYSELPKELAVKAAIQDKVWQESPNVQRVSYAAEISVPLTLNPQDLANTGETLQINKTLSVAGQSVEFKNVYISTTGIYLETAYSPGNSKQIFGLIKPYILLGSGNDLSGLYSKMTLTQDGGETLVFPNDNTVSDSLKLQINGIIAIDKSAQELIVDTDKKQIIKGPDERLGISAAAKAHSMVLEYYRSAKKGSEDSVNVILDETFKDGTGKIHTMGVPDLSFPLINPDYADQKIPPYQHYYNLGTEDLPQPLTFRIISYPNSIKEKASLTIRE